MIGSSSVPRPALVAVGELYVTGEDHLLLTSFNAAASVALTLTGRILTPEGRIVPFAQSHTPNTDRTSATAMVRLSEGWLQQVTVIASSGAPLRGQTFVRVDLARGDNTGRTTLGTLLQGYVTATYRRAWPGSPLESSLEGAGCVRAVAGSDPAAGVDITETVPTGARWLVRAMHATFVTDATAANREPAYVVDDGANVIARIPMRVNHVASTNHRYTFAEHLPSGQAIVTDTTRLLPIPALTLLAGFRVRTITTTLQAGDNWGAPMLHVEEWLEATA